ncbi:N-6 DNA methylase [Microbispora amethystogenes]|uniref:N-6 DNA methylase n=1 Tax=Microbispora amethystogenes TaxID=1427754 RepID=UPI0019538136|nr:N-6 DNA methylase [Microbispora amethystogenes]
MRRPTITTWAKRHRDFPQPISFDKQEYFSLAEALKWLNGRMIAEKDRRAGEPPGFTYGARVQHAISIAHQVTSDEDGPVHSDAAPASTSLDPSDSNTEPALQRLLGALATSFRDGVNSQADYLTLVLCLTFLIRCAPDLRSEILKVTTRPPAELRPAAIMRRIGELTDQALRAYGIPPGARSTLERMRTPSGVVLAEVIRLCDHLGPAAFRTLLDHLATAMRFESGDYFTPRGVANLMARLATGDGDRDENLPVYDPWLRGGEMLHAAGALQPGSGKSLHGASPNPETLRLAGMNLAMHGQTVQLHLGSTTPWREASEPRARASAVLMNPPFNMRSARPTGGHDDWLFGPPPLHNDNYAWLQFAVDSLATGGKAAVLMPHQAGVSSDECEHAIRRKMVEQGTVEAIIALPARLFPVTTTAVSIWVLSPPSVEPKRILFVDAADAAVVTRQDSVLLPPNAIDILFDIYRRRHLLPQGKVERLANLGYAVSADIDTLRQADYSLDPADYIADMSELARAPWADAHSMLDELMRLKAKVDELDIQAAQLRPVPRAGLSRSLPSGWNRITLSDLCTIQAGPSFSRLGVAERVAHGSVPIVMPRHLQQGLIVANDADRTTVETAERLTRFRLRVDDILCVRSGAMGQSAIVREQQEGWLFGGNLHRLRLLTADIVDPHYLLTFLNLPSTMNWIRRRSRATVIPFINARDLGQLIVTVPPLDEQRQIRSALNTLDEQAAIHEQFTRAVMRARTALAEQLLEGVVISR